MTVTPDRDRPPAAGEGPRQQPGYRDHPLRAALIAEFHARPFAALDPPEQVSHLAFVSGEVGARADYAHLVRLCESYGISPPPEGTKHFAWDFRGFRLKWERHGEFCTYTFLRQEPFEHPFSKPAILAVPRRWLEDIPGERLVSVHVAVAPRGSSAPTAADLAAIFRSETVSGSRVFGGAALVWTDFAIHEDGFGRILILDVALDRFEAGRLVQRLLEIESYRMMALLALPPVQENRPRIAQIEEETAEIAWNMSRIESLEDTRAALARLSRLSADVEGITARLSYRLDAARAYHALVRRRIERLREDRIEGLQTIEEFMERRLGPAMQTCATTGARLESLSRRLARASDLLRTRVDVGLQEQNRDLLQSMDRRARLQSRMQRTLEFISMIALTYYLSVLLTAVLRAVNAAGFAVDVDLAAGAATPMLLGVVWLGLLWARRTVIRRQEQDRK